MVFLEMRTKDTIAPKSILYQKITGLIFQIVIMRLVLIILKKMIVTIDYLCMHYISSFTVIMGK